MFGRPDEEVVANLERLRGRLCLYGPVAERCDCKFGASGKGEESGCPEIRQAIAIITGQREGVAVFEKMMEDSAVNAMKRITVEVEAHNMRASGRAD